MTDSTRRALLKRLGLLTSVSLGSLWSTGTASSSEGDVSIRGFRADDDVDGREDYLHNPRGRDDDVDAREDYLHNPRGRDDDVDAREDYLHSPRSRRDGPVLRVITSQAGTPVDRSD